MSEEQWYGSTGRLGLSRLGMMRLGLANTPPRFVMEPYVFSVAAGAAVGTFVGTVFAVDDCADEVTYTLHGPDAVNFAIDPDSGVITTAALLTEDSYSFIVRATDIEGAPCGVDEATVTVNVVEVVEEKDCDCPACWLTGPLVISPIAPRRCPCLTEDP